MILARLFKNFEIDFLIFAQSSIRSKILAKVKPEVSFFRCLNYEMNTNLEPETYQTLEFATIDITKGEINKFSLTRLITTDPHASTQNLQVKSKKFILFNSL